MTALDHAAFADPPTASQATFRTLLAAMAQPGTVHRLSAALTPPPPLDVATAAALLTLIDGETSLHIAPAFSPCRDWIAFHCGVAPSAMPDRAAYTLCDTLPDLDTLDAGSDVAPEDSATVILQLAALDRGSAFTLTGPGLAAPRTLRAEGLPGDFPAWWQANHARFPRGVDLILCAGKTLAALPRSVAIS